MSKQKLLNLTNDYIFKRTFGYEESSEITKIFLRDILQDKIKHIELNNQTITEKELMDDKVGIMDIKAVLNENIQCDVEMQVINKHNIEKRILFYWAKMYAQTIKEGDEYNDLKKSICVLLADFELDNLREIKKYKTKWNIREEEYKSVILTDVLELAIIELPKYVRYANKEKKENLNLWLKFIKDPEVKIMENNEDEKSVKETKQAIQKAQEELEKISQDEHERYLAELRQKHIMDTNAVRALGYDKAKMDIAKKLKEEKVDIIIISKATGLTKEEIEKL